MDLLTFTEKIKNGLREFYGDQAKVVLENTIKNNGIERCGISIRGKSNLAIVVYMEKFYEEYKSGKTIGEIVYEITKINEKNRKEKSLDIDFLRDYEKVKKKLVWRLVNHERNKKRLEDIPHIPCMDLEMVFYCEMYDETLGNISILIQNEHCNLWKIDVEQLKKDAIENAQRILPAQCVHLSKMIPKEMRLCEKNENTEEGMYILSNQHLTYGAAAMLYPGELEKFAEKKECNLFILPSSVHEVLLLPDRGEENLGFLMDMVRKINREEVSEEEILSDSVYYYDREKKEIRVLEE